MSDLMLEHLKLFHRSQARIERKLDDLTARVSSLESGHAVLVGHMGHIEMTLAGQQVALDKINNRLDRIERRLSLAEEA